MEFSYDSKIRVREISRREFRVIQIGKHIRVCSLDDDRLVTALPLTLPNYGLFEDRPGEDWTFDDVAVGDIVACVHRELVDIVAVYPWVSWEKISGSATLRNRRKRVKK
jgi:hypothetical protein